MRMYKTVSSLVLLAAFALPVASFARDDHDHDRDHDRRYYDRAHKDYHHWDAREDTAYRRWFAENHREYRDWDHIRDRDRQRYWAWRHEHPDER